MPWWMPPLTGLKRLRKRLKRTRRSLRLRCPGGVLWRGLWLSFRERGQGGLRGSLFRCNLRVFLLGNRKAHFAAIVGRYTGQGPLYHVTAKAHLPSIMRQGLLGGSNGLVYTLERMDLLLPFARKKYGADDSWIILRVDADGARRCGAELFESLTGEILLTGAAPDCLQLA